VKTVGYEGYCLSQIFAVLVENDESRMFLTDVNHLNVYATRTCVSCS
jgi:hypothetical protein